MLMSVGEGLGSAPKKLPLALKSTAAASRVSDFPAVNAACKAALANHVGDSSLRR